MTIDTVSVLNKPNYAAIVVSAVAIIIMWSNNEYLKVNKSHPIFWHVLIIKVIKNLNYALINDSSRGLKRNATCQCQSN